jgi:L-cysteine/cystine lyase
MGHAMSTVEAESKIDLIREELPAVSRHVYLNTGTFGPLPRAALEAMLACQDAEFNEGRILPGSWDRADEVKAAARQEIADILGCPAGNIASTRHTTDGLNIGILGINWRPGDEIVISDLEHPGAQAPVYNIARRFGVTVRTARLGVGDGDAVSAFERVITPRTRMVVVSHVAWNTGAILPLGELVDLAHRHHALLVADAAQSAGMIPVDVTGIGVDVYALPGQKWLCGPEESGAIYVSEEALEQLQPTVTGYFSAAPHGWEHAGGYYLPAEGAGRFEVGGVNMPKISGLLASLTWIRETVGWDWAYERIADIGASAARSLVPIPGVAVITPTDRMTGLICFSVEGIKPADLVERLWERGIIIRSIPSPSCVRLSTGFYNTEEDINQLLEVVEETAHGK